MGERILVTSAGIGGSNNLIRSLRAGDSSLQILGCHDDRFFLKKSLADDKHLLPPLEVPAGARALRALVTAAKIDLVIPTTDSDVAALSRLGSTLGGRVFLPRRSVVDVCQDKYRLNTFLSSRGVPVPRTQPVRRLGDLDRAFRRVAVGSRAWCRIRGGSGSLGAIAVRSARQARDWIRYWQEMRQTRAGSFIVSEYLPGRDLGCQSLWKDGTLVVVKTYERLSYLTTGSQPTETSSVAGLAKTVVDPRLVEICTVAVRALDARASGVFSIDLRENARGIPCITEINAGRFTSATPIFDLTGKYNMAATYVRLALGTPVEIRDVYDVAPDHYMLRDLDTPPCIFHADDFFEGITEPGVTTDRPTGRRRDGRFQAHRAEEQSAARARDPSQVQGAGGQAARAQAGEGHRRAEEEVRPARQAGQGGGREAQSARGVIPVNAPRGLDAPVAEAFRLELRRLAKRYGADIDGADEETGPVRRASPSRGRA